ncbi:MAG: glucosylglycerol-phosphate synthase [Sphingobium sp.]
MKKSSLVIVYHRQPYEEVVENGQTVFRANKSPNGIVPTLKSFFRRLEPGGGAWVAWKQHNPGIDEEFERVIHIDDDNGGFTVRRLPLTAEQANSFYKVTSKEAFWPVLHSFPWLYSYDPVDWPTFQEVNRLFAEAAAEQADEGALVWIHDYNLWLVPHYLRRLRPDVKIAFFHHTPFPSADIFNVLPWRQQILESLLDCDMVGFHIPRYAKNFADLAVALSDAKITERADVGPHLHVPGQALSEPRVPTHLRSAAGRDVLVDVAPVSADVHLIDEVLATEESLALQKDIHDSLRDRKLIVSVARTDYTKGTVEALLAFERLLERRPELRQQVKMLCISVRAASGMTIYDETQRDIEGHVGRINGRFSMLDWTPIVFKTDPMPFDELLAHYRIADLCLTTPLRDGMNLVAKEFVAAKDGRPGALVVSEFAGCAVELPDAIYTNPNGHKDVDRAIDEALAMDADESAARMAKMRETIAKYDIVYWIEHTFGNFRNIGFEPNDQMKLLATAN